MAIKTRIESEMPIICEDSFDIEDWVKIHKIGEGVKSVEIVRLKSEWLVFIEAKTTLANPNQGDSIYYPDIDKQENA